MTTTNDERARAERRVAEALGSASCSYAVIGLGFIGSTLMDALISSGVEAHGVDRDPAAVERFLARGAHAQDVPRPWSVGCDASALSGADAVFVAVRFPVAADGEVDTDNLRSVASMLGAGRKERLVLLESTVPPGTTRRFAGWLTNTAGLFVAHSPERLAVGHDWRMLKKIPHVVGGLDDAATRLAEIAVRRICDTVVPVSSPEVSELCKLLENAFLSVGIALVGEVARVAHALGVSAREVTDAAATKPFGYYPFHPMWGVGGHCLPNDLRMLGATARATGGGSALLDSAVAAIAEHPARAVDRLEGLLQGNAKSLRGARVLLVGVGFKVGSPETFASPAQDVVRVLRSRGAEPLYLDSRVDAFEVDSQPVPRVAPDRLGASGISAVMVLAGDPDLSARHLEPLGVVVLDAGGGRILDGGLPSAHRL